MQRMRQRSAARECGPVHTAQSLRHIVVWPRYQASLHPGARKGRAHAHPYNALRVENRPLVLSGAM